MHVMNLREKTDLARMMASEGYVPTVPEEISLRTAKPYGDRNRCSLDDRSRDSIIVAVPSGQLAC